MSKLGELLDRARIDKQSRVYWTIAVPNTWRDPRIVRSAFVSQEVRDGGVKYSAGDLLMNPLLLHLAQSRPVKWSVSKRIQSYLEAAEKARILEYRRDEYGVGYRIAAVKFLIPTNERKQRRSDIPRSLSFTLPDIVWSDRLYYDAFDLYPNRYGLPEEDATDLIAEAMEHLEKEVYKIPHH